MNIKHIVTLGVVVVGILVGTLYLADKNESALLSENTVTKTCYIWNTEDGSRAELIVNAQDDKITGDFYWKPKDKDSKTGPFEGTLSAGENETKILIAEWNVYSEGVLSVEELFIKFSIGIAAPGFSEMTVVEDGIFRYADPEKIVYEPNLSLADCETEIVSQPVNSQYEPERRTLTGTYVCLPHRNTEGPQTLECALGLKADDGSYYALDFMLSSQLAPNFATGDRITVSGVFTPIERLSTNHWQKYNMIGILSVTDSARKI